MREGDVDRSTLLKVLVAFWTTFVILFLVRNVTEDLASGAASLARRIPMAMLGAGLCWLMVVIFRRLSPSTWLARLSWVAGLSIPAGIVFAVANSLAFHYISTRLGEGCGSGRPCDVPFLTLLAIEYSVNCAFVFTAWGMLYFALRGTAEALAAERQLSAAREATRIAEIRALRYQVNPHFLFNCLNSLGTLVDRGDNDVARGMINEMSGFLRYGLASDPVADVELDDEIEMQRRYLEIERRRFAHRMEIDIDVDEAVRRARVPSLILQPLVENAIKHGVASTSAPVRVSMSAHAEPSGHVVVIVEENAPASRAGSPAGMGIGLRNVAERLAARFGAAATLEAGPLPRGGFRARVSMPPTAT